MTTSKTTTRAPTRDNADASKVAQESSPEPCCLDTYVDRTEAARILGVKPATLADWAVKGFGPPIAKFGRAAKYNVRKLLAWAEARTVLSTATFGRGA